jgi:transposase InsO family protein
MGVMYFVAYAALQSKAYADSCTIRDPHAEPFTDRVDRKFAAAGPDRLWVTDITEHPAGEGKLYCAAVLDAFSRRIVGWSIAGHMRTELVLDALGMAVLRRQPVSKQTILHSDHGSQFTSWRFGQRLLKVEILGSMGSVGDCYDNAMMESFWGTLQLEVLDSKEWNTRDELANAIFEWIETSYQRCVSSCGSYGIPEGSGWVVHAVVLQAVMQLAEHEVEQPTQRGDMPVAGLPAGPIASVPERVVPHRGQRPHVSGGRDPVVLRAAGVHEAAFA